MGGRWKVGAKAFGHCQRAKSVLRVSLVSLVSRDSPPDCVRIRGLHEESSNDASIHMARVSAVTGPGDVV